MLKSIKGHNSGMNLRKWTLNKNPKLYVININAYVKFGQKSIPLFARYGAEIKILKSFSAVTLLQIDENGHFTIPS